jgi:site-specific DNA-methyltransferase (adenine-specific)
MKDISANSIDLIICDLPYGCLSGRAIGKTAEDKKCWSGAEEGCPWDVKIDLEAFWKEVKRIRKDEHSPTIHFCTTKFGYDLIKSNEKEFRYDLVWTKTNAVGFLQANKMPMRAHEMMYVFSKAGAHYERIDISGNFPFNGGGRSDATFIPGINALENIVSDNTGKRCVKSYVEVANKKTKGGHPTAKPVDLYKWLIERFCPVGGTVLDPTFGSCNSGKAARELNRNYIGIEMNKVFFDKAK